MKEQPAIKSYFFEDGYKDLWEIIRSSWSKNIDSSQMYFGKSDSENWFMKILYYSIGLSVVTFGTVFFVSLSIVHILILFLLLMLIYLAFTVIWSIDAGYRVKNKIFTACPNPDCYAKSPLPVYHCPKCGANHDCLWPSEYGILKRTCKCGEELPTTFFNGRSKLRATCPICDEPIVAYEARPVVIPIVGAPSVGKTFFVISMVYHIKELLAKKTGHKFKFMDSPNESIYKSEISLLNSGQVLRKTTEKNPIALNFFLTKNGSKSLLFLYDSAGEAFTNTHYLSQQKYYNYFSGLIFIIDPFSIPEIHRQYKKQLSTNTAIRPSNFPLEDVYDVLINNLEKNYAYKVTEQITKPVAILFSKTDAFDLQDKIGKQAVEKCLAANSTILTAQEAMNKLCKEFLSSNGMDALLRKMEWKFPNSSYFAISSGGENSIGIDHATNWILGKIDKSYIK